jgi:hypothetical protein
MERAAQLRAQGCDWQEVADQTGLTYDTVSHYPSRYPPFEVYDPDRQGLVGWYRERLWNEEVEELAREVQPEALKALLEVLEARDVAGTDVGPTFGALTGAARAALKATGFETGRATRQKLEAQEEITGEPGERVHVHEADRFGDLDDDELDDRISELEDIVDDDE